MWIKDNTDEFSLCLCAVDPSRIVIPIAVSAGTTLVLVPFLVWLIPKRQKRRNDDDNNRRPLLGNRAVRREANPIPERYPVPESLAGRAEGSSSFEGDANNSSANVWVAVSHSCLLRFAIDVPWRLACVRSPSLGACNYLIFLSRRFHRPIYF